MYFLAYGIGRPLNAYYPQKLWFAGQEELPPSCLACGLSETIWLATVEQERLAGGRD